MEKGSSSRRRTWADEVEDEELAASAGLNSNAAPFYGSSPAAGASRLNPDASPFFGGSPASGYGERLPFTDSEASDSEPDPDLEPPLPEEKGKAVAPGGSQRW